MIRRIVLAVLIAVIVTLGCTLLGTLLDSLTVAVAITIGDFLKAYAAVIGIIAGLWYFFAGRL
jgi:hypothetical protein